MNNQDNKGLDLNELYIEELGQVVGGADQKSSIFDTFRFDPKRIPSVTLMLGEGGSRPFPLPLPTRSLFEDIQRWLPITKVAT